MSDTLWEDLWNKHQTLYDYLQSLNAQLDPAERPDYEGAIKNAELEIMRLEGVMDAIDAGKPIRLPSDEQVRELQIATGHLQQAVQAGARVEALVGAAADVINSWPVS
jgi:hypothetical protein